MCLNVLAGCNASGTEKMPLMIIGKSSWPCPFGRKSAAELGFDNHHNVKDWMNKDIYLHGSSVWTIKSEEETASALCY